MIVEEIAGHREPEEEEEDDVREEVEHLIGEVEAEEERTLREHQVEDDLPVSVDQD